MSRIAYVNGRYVPLHRASVHVEDRGLQFSDAVYEVFALQNGHLRDEAAHYARLYRSLRELEIQPPLPETALRSVITETIRRNRLHNAIVYLQVTRGVAPRNHAFPSANVRAGLIVTIRPQDWRAAETKAARGVGVVTTPDIRWGRCDIKSTSLLPNVLAKQAAKVAGAFEAWMVDKDGYVTEGSSTNAWIINASGEIITRPLGDNILPGVTRSAIIAMARKRQISVIERPFSLAEAKSASEAFITAATAFLTPVVQIDDVVVGDGRPGPVATALRNDYVGLIDKVGQALPT